MPAPDTPAARLLLLRLAAKAARTPAKVRADLAPLLDPAPNAEAFGELVAELRDAGLVAPKPPGRSTALAVTDEGRARAGQVIGVDDLPATLTWSQIQARYLVPLALGGQPGGQLRADAVRARALKRKHRLPVATRDTVSAALEAIACKELGFADCVTLKEVLTRTLIRAADVTSPKDPKKLKDLVARKLLGLSTASQNELPHALIRAWAAGISVPAPKPEPAADALDLPAFAAAVLAAARGCKTGRYGADTVFVNHVHRAYAAAGHPELSLAAFKDRLLDANAAGLLQLARADEPTRADADDVRDSEIKRLHTLFDLVRTNA